MMADDGARTCLRSFLSGILARASPHPGLHAADLATALVAEGAASPGDLVGMDAAELRGVWPALLAVPGPALDRIVAEAASWQPTQAPVTVTQSPPPPARVVHVDERDAPGMWEARRALWTLVEARDAGCPPAPAALAAAVRVVARVKNCPVVLLGLGPKPRARGTALAEPGGLSEDRRSKVKMVALWRELCQWKKSGAQYASAVECWGLAGRRRAAPPARVFRPRRRIPRRLAQVPPWPPCDATVEILAAMCSNPTTLRHYLSRVRSVLHLLRAPIGVLDQTRGLVAGAAKCGDPASRRYKASASAAQAWCRAPRVIRAGGWESRHPLVVARCVSWRSGCGGRRSDTMSRTQLS